MRQNGLNQNDGAAPLANQVQTRLRQAFLHSPPGGKDVKLALGEFADHNVRISRTLQGVLSDGHRFRH